MIVMIGEMFTLKTCQNNLHLVTWFRVLLLVKKLVIAVELLIVREKNFHKIVLNSCGKVVEVLA